MPAYVWRYLVTLDELCVGRDETTYDRLRFGGPTSRDTLIDSVRNRYPLDIPGAIPVPPLPLVG